MTNEPKLRLAAGDTDGRSARADRMRQGRNAAVLEAAVTLAKAEGYQWITRDAVAKAAGVSAGSVNNAFRTMRELKREVLREAIKRQIVEIVAQGLADRHAIALDAPADLKHRAAALLV